MASSSSNAAPGRVALVTGGATVVFKELLDETLSLQFLKTLRAHGFSKVVVQCGSLYAEISKKINVIETDAGLTIEAFAFSHDLQELMKLCRGEPGVRLGGVVISHAGTGTISDCLEVDCAQIVVVNPNLMDNHQQEIADQVASDVTQIIVGKLGRLAEAIPEIVKIIDEEGLNEPKPFEEMVFPVAEEDRVTLIDLVASAFMQQ